MTNQKKRNFQENPSFSSYSNGQQQQPQQQQPKKQKKTINGLNIIPCEAEREAEEQFGRASSSTSSSSTASSTSTSSSFPTNATDPTSAVESFSLSLPSVSFPTFSTNVRPNMPPAYYRDYRRRENPIKRAIRLEKDVIRHRLRYENETEAEKEARRARDAERHRKRYFEKKAKKAAAAAAAATTAVATSRAAVGVSSNIPSLPSSLPSTLPLPLLPLTSYQFLPPPPSQFPPSTDGGVSLSSPPAFH